jgi:membrane dipeptidase
MIASTTPWHYSTRISESLASRLLPALRLDAATPLSAIAAHARYVADRIGVEHVGLGSDFDGATIPAELGDASGLPRLLDALRAAGFGEPELEAIAWDNWRRVLEAAW